MKPKSKKFNYEKEFLLRENAWLLTSFPLLMFITAYPLSVLAFFAVVARLLKEGFDINNDLGDFVGTILLLIIVPTISFVIINQFNSIRVTKKGLLVRVFIFYYQWKFVPWEEVLELKLSPLLDRWKKPVWCIKVKKLTLAHQLLSQVYLTGPGYSIVLTSDLEDRDFILDIIESHLD